MKPPAVIVNIARGPIINQSDLLLALQNHTIRGAGLDVFTAEPSDSTPDPEIVALAQLENTIVTPHIAFHTYEVPDKLGAELVSIIKRCIERA